MTGTGASQDGETVPAAETAEKKGISGDANNDGRITVSDAVAVLQYIANAETYSLSEQGLLNADCDGVSGITGADAIAIQMYDAGVIDMLPVAEG